MTKTYRRKIKISTRGKKYRINKRTKRKRRYKSKKNGRYTKNGGAALNSALQKIIDSRINNDNIGESEALMFIKLALDHDISLDEVVDIDKKCVLLELVHSETIVLNEEQQQIVNSWQPECIEETRRLNVLRIKTEADRLETIKQTQIREKTEIRKQQEDAERMRKEQLKQKQQQIESDNRQKRLEKEQAIEAERIAVAELDRQKIEAAKLKREEDNKIREEKKEMIRQGQIRKETEKEQQRLMELERQRIIDQENIERRQMLEQEELEQKRIIDEAETERVRMLEQEKLQREQVAEQQEVARRQQIQQKELEDRRLEEIERNRGALLPDTIPAIEKSREYANDKEPPFWKPLFNRKGETNTLFKLRHYLVSIIKDKSVCPILESILPNYYTSNKDNEVKIRLCSIMLIYGIINDVLKYEKYTLVFKGGKAIQMVLSDLMYPGEYDSTDIDILLLPRKGIPYNVNNLSHIAENIRELINWLSVGDALSGYVYTALIEPGHNPFIIKIKLRYPASSPALSDIDFREVPSNLLALFQNTEIREYTIPASLTTHPNIKLSFCYPSLYSLLNERMYYLVEYITNEIFTGENQQFNLKKIYKGLHPLLSAIVLKDRPDLTNEDISQMKENKLREILTIYLSRNDKADLYIPIILNRMFHPKEIDRGIEHALLLRYRPPDVTARKQSSLPPGFLDKFNKK